MVDPSLHCEYSASTHITMVDKSLHCKCADITQITMVDKSLHCKYADINHMISFMIHITMGSSTHNVMIDLPW